MKTTLKIYKVDFEGMWPVGNCLVIAAFNLQQAETIAHATIKHTSIFTVSEIVLNEPQVIIYLSGDY